MVPPRCHRPRASLSPAGTTQAAAMSLPSRSESKGLGIDGAKNVLGLGFVGEPGACPPILRRPFTQQEQFRPDRYTGDHAVESG